MMINRREFLLLSLASLITAACDRSTSSSSHNSISTNGTTWHGLEKAAEPYKGATLRILGEDLPPLHSLSQLQSEFFQKTGAYLQIDFKNHSNVIKSILAGALNQGYQYDIIFVPHKELGRLIQLKSIRPLDSIFGAGSLRDPTIQPKNQFFEPFWTEVSSYENTWYAVPLYLGGSIVVCRDDLLNSHNEAISFSEKYKDATLGYPRNYKEWLRLANFFNRPHASPALFGIALLLSEESLWYEWQSMLFAFGGNVLDTKHGWEYGDIVVNSPEAISATDAYREMMKFSPPDATTYSWGLGISKQQAGQNFMTLLQYDVVSEFESPEKTSLAGKFGYFLPVGPDGRKASQMESWVGVIPTTAKSPELSWLLLQWIMGAEIQLKMHLEGNVSPRRSTYDDPRVRAMKPTETILESLKYMVPKPTIPEASAIQKILTTRLQEVMTGQKTTKSALDLAAKEIHMRLEGRVKMRFPG